MDQVPPITAWLRRVKRERNVSLRNIAEFAHLSTNTVKNILDGKVERPEPETIAKLAEWAKVSKDELMALAGYVSEAPSQRSSKVERDEHIDKLLDGKTPEEMLDLLPEGVREDLAVSFRRVPGKAETYARIVRAVVADYLRAQPRD